MKKIPIVSGAWKSDWNEVGNAYAKHKEIIHRQIKEYMPDFVLYGNTIPFLQEDFSFTEMNQKKVSDIAYYEKDKQFHFAIYHPAAIVSKRDYVENIISAIKYLSQ